MKKDLWKLLLPLVVEQLLTSLMGTMGEMEPKPGKNDFTYFHSYAMITAKRNIAEIAVFAAYGNEVTEEL